MYFHIASDLLTVENSIDLHAILNFALQGALFIKLGNNNDETVDYWLKSRPPQERSRWKTVTESSLKAQTKFKTLDRIEVIAGNGQSDWNADCPRLNLKDAVTIAGQAKRVILENSRADRKFILAMADDQLRKRLIELQNAGRLEFSHAGGIGEMRSKPNESSRPNRRARGGFSTLGLRVG